MESPVEKILEVCQRIQNSRTIPSVFCALRREVEELNDEVLLHVDGKTEGADGIIGESVDVILCAVDLIYQKKPDITKEQIMEVINRKLTKWETLYSNV